MRFKLVRYVGQEIGWDVAFALERPDGQLERTSGPGSEVRTFDHPREAFDYVKHESGASRDFAGDRSYCVTWEGTTY